MQSILIPLSVHRQAEGAISHAISLAQTFSSYIEALIVKPVFRYLANESIVSTAHYDQLHLQNWRTKANELQAGFDESIRRAGIELGEPGVIIRGPTAGWRELEGREHTVVGEYGRIFDIIIIGRGQDERSNEFIENYEAALFESGRPVLLAPSEPVDKIGRTVVISWDGSTESARTIALGMPLIDRAGAVFVLTVEGAKITVPTGAEVATYLSRRGINAMPIATGATNCSDGEAILEKAAALGADILFKGAYTHSRLRHMVIGGPTKHILHHAHLPVLMAH